MWSQHFGTNKLDAAKKCIADNLRNYVSADARGNPANYNLYNALNNIIGEVEDSKRTIEELIGKVRRLQNDLDDAQREINNLKRRG